MNEREVKYLIVGGVLVVLGITTAITVSYLNRTPMERCNASCDSLGITGHWERTADGRESCTCVKTP